MEQREESNPAAGLLIAALAVATAFGVWLHGARPGLYGAFEGQRDWSLLYADLPCMLIGLPAVTLAVWTLTRVALRRRLGRGARGLASGTVAVVVLLVLAWACLAWLGARVGWVSPQ
ncbi:hypothetical protein OG607_08305 [Streptomyces sp. NBC_01537]|uniref:hypothetical protein n=1 Tax=Streptomyces sp. NBC_01537 TaxID=2903896 RepID=UPI00386B84CB